MSLRWTLIAVLAAVLGGVSACSRESPASAAGGTNAPPPSAAQRTINDLTGKTAVDAGQRTKAQIEAINAARKKQFDEITE